MYRELLLRHVRQFECEAYRELFYYVMFVSSSVLWNEMEQKCIENFTLTSHPPVRVRSVSRTLLFCHVRQFECFCVMKWSKNVSRTLPLASRSSVRVRSVSRTFTYRHSPSVRVFLWNAMEQKCIENIPSHITSVCSSAKRIENCSKKTSRYYFKF